MHWSLKTPETRRAWWLKYNGRQEPTQFEKRVLECLRQEGRSSAAELVSCTGSEIHAIGAACSRLFSQGYADRFPGTPVRWSSTHLSPDEEHSQPKPVLDRPFSGN